jgi:predicted amino acid dehydrogenase
MDRFGFVIHITDSELMARAFEEPALDFNALNPRFKKRVVERSLRWFPPFKCADIKGVKSKTGKEVEGFFIFCPLIPEQILNMDQDFVLNKIVESCNLAKQLGADIVGLGAYMSQIGRKGMLVAKQVDIPVTTGTSYTIAVTVDSVIKAAHDLQLDMDECKLAVIGASGAIGSICSRLLAPKCKEIVLAARNITRLKNLSQIINKESGLNPILTTDIKDAVRKSDIVIFSTNDPRTLITTKDIKTGSIICDISIPKNVSENIVRSRSDILVIDGGIVKPPGNPDFNFYFGPPPGMAYACIAETMILTLEHRFESYSIGADISIEKVREIKRLGDKHGFTLAKFRSFYGDITEERINAVRSAVKNRPTRVSA